MSTTELSARHVAAIHNAGWWVRHYVRGSRMTRIHVAERQEAIQRLGLAVRDAFNECDDFEALLTAIVDGLVPREPRF